MQYQEILELVREVSKAGLSHFEYTEGNIRISMSCQEKNSAVSVSPEQMQVIVAQEGMTQEPADAPKQETAVKSAGHLVKSPLVGTFYAAPSEEAEPFVKEGDHVKKGQTLAIVEAMKLMNEIESEFDGIVTEILIGNGEAVEYGQPLFRIE